MTINWPEVLIGGAIFFVLGSTFSIFAQPTIARRLERRRESSLRRQEAADADFQALVLRLADDPALFAAVSQADTASIMKHALRALLWVFVSMVVGGVVYFVGSILLVGAIIELPPIARLAKRHYDMTGAVADTLLAASDADAKPAPHD